MKITKKLILAALAACIFTSGLTACGGSDSSSSASEVSSLSSAENPDSSDASASESSEDENIVIEEMRDITAWELCSEMTIGWNLGNTLDAYSSGMGSETAWGNPEASQEFINSVKEAGFNTIRIPVTYMGNIDDANGYKIDEAWLSRVQEVVDYAVEADMYIIMNIHHDGNNDNGSWIDVTADDQTAIQEKFAAVWEQIANKFKGYNEKLVFESMNEIMEPNIYSRPRKKTTYPNINALNQIFVETVRSTGANNEKRVLLVPGYNTNIEYTCNSRYGFELPTDSAADKLAVSAHFYDPYDYALNEGNSEIFKWGQYADSNVLDYGNEADVDNAVSAIKNFTDNKIPVIIGEYGCIDKSHIDPSADAYRRYYLEYVTRAMKKVGAVPVYWDNGWSGDNGFALFDRTTGDVLHQNLVEAMVRAATATEDYEIASPA